MRASHLPQTSAIAIFCVLAGAGCSSQSLFLFGTMKHIPKTAAYKIFLTHRFFLGKCQKATEPLCSMLCRNCPKIQLVTSGLGPMMPDQSIQTRNRSTHIWPVPRSSPTYSCACCLWYLWRWRHRNLLLFFDSLEHVAWRLFLTDIS